jgi:hypothetical protein
VHLSRDRTSFARVAGAVLAAEPTVTEVSTETEEVYERRFSVVQRLVKLFVSPSEAMEDIARAPDYMGVFIVIAAITVVSAVAIFLVLQKFILVGTYADALEVLLSMF